MAVAGAKQPLYELYDNLLHYGPIIAAIPVQLARHTCICSEPEKPPEKVRVEEWGWSGGGGRADREVGGYTVGGLDMAEKGVLWGGPGLHARTP
jgi:hypothetical protein